SRAWSNPWSLLEKRRSTWKGYRQQDRSGTGNGPREPAHGGSNEESRPEQGQRRSRHCSTYRNNNGLCWYHNNSSKLQQRHTTTTEKGGRDAAAINNSSRDASTFSGSHGLHVRQLPGNVQRRRVRRGGGGRFSRGGEGAAQAGTGCTSSSGGSFAGGLVSGTKDICCRRRQAPAWQAEKAGPERRWRCPG
ncbi:unnamed protein product, partial [Ectocarpus sp. 8 AP-2014]